MIRWPDPRPLAKKFAAAKPFRHAIVDGLLAPADHARLREGLGAEPLVRAEGEIYSHLRGADPPLQPALRAFFDALQASCATVSEICGRRLSWADGAAYAYLAGDYLLPHSDALAELGRAVAYAYYLAAPDQGGELELFECSTREGLIVRTRPAKRIAVRPRRLVLFEVHDAALHQVREVLAGARHSVAGWFYP
jgi:hypothetical protein